MMTRFCSVHASVVATRMILILVVVVTQQLAWAFRPSSNLWTVMSTSLLMNTDSDRMVSSSGALSSQKEGSINSPQGRHRTEDQQQRIQTLYASTDDKNILVLDFHLLKDNRLPESSISVRRVIENAPNPTGMPVGGGGPGKLSSEWIIHHPTLPLLYAVTGYWDQAPSVLVCYNTTDVSNNNNSNSNSNNNSKNGIHRFYSTSTGGLQGQQIQISPNGEYVAVANYLDGSVALFETTELTPPPSIKKPLCIMALPSNDKGVASHKERNPQEYKNAFYRGPLAHGIAFSPDGDHLLVCDAGQACIVTYHLPSLLQERSSVNNYNTTTTSTSGYTICSTEHLEPPPNQSSFGSLMKYLQSKFGNRPRHLVIDPAGRHVYVIHEMANTISHHHVDYSCDDAPSLATVSPPIQSISSLYLSPKTGIWKKLRHWLTIYAACEIVWSLNHKFLLVTNRALCLWPQKGNDDDCKSTLVVLELDSSSGEIMSHVDVHVIPGVPRHLTLIPHPADPNNKSLVITATQKEGIFLVFEQDNTTGRLTKLVQTSPTGHSITCIATAATTKLTPPSPS